MYEYLDITFAQVGAVSLCLDLFVPESATRPPLIVFIHGGAWEAGSRKKCRMEWLVERGYALASVDYRLSGQARFPAQIHDCKAAVRWLRAHAERFGYDADRIAALGVSAGGHLAALLGVNSAVRELEGDVGSHLDVSSRVQAVVDYYGPTDFILRAQTQPERTEPPGSRGHKLLGCPVRDNEAIARLASPAWHVSADAAPLLIIHGTADTTVLLDQSQRLFDAYRGHKLDVQLHLVPGAAHGGPQYALPEHRRPVAEFLDSRLRHSAPATADGSV